MKKKNVLNLVVGLLVGLCLGGVLVVNAAGGSAANFNSLRGAGYAQEMMDVYNAINENADVKNDFTTILKSETEAFTNAKTEEGVLTNEQAEKVNKLLERRFDENEFICGRCRDNIDCENNWSFITEDMSEEEVNEYLKIHEILTNEENRKEYSKIVEKSFDQLVDKYSDKGIITEKQVQMIKEFFKNRQEYGRCKYNQRQKSNCLFHQ